MITKDNFKAVLESLGFVADLSGIWTKSFADGAFALSVDFTGERLIYPESLKVNERQTCNFSAPENFVVFECVHRLFEKGYKPEHVELEHHIKLGHGSSGGRLDIWVKDNNGRSVLIIECKTAGTEFDGAWKDTLEDGGQLFSYANALDSKTPFVALYASEWNGSAVVPVYHLVSLQDNEEFLKTLRDDALCFKKAATAKERFRAWRDTYQSGFTTRGLFEDDIAAYTIGKTKYSIRDLKVVDGSEIQGKYHEFATILRQHNVASHENAFDKLVNLFLAKIVDETENPDELKFYWKGAAYDDAFNLIDRLQFLYKRGMEEFLNETVTYIDNKNIEDAFRLFKKDATKRTILDYFRQLKFFTNNDFAFVDVHNEKLFHQNAAVLLRIVRMLQDISLKTQEQNQFLGDLFEGFLDKGVKQSEGQFFTPTPIVRFLISSLPLQTIITESPKPPLVIDYACGAGHFLNEYCNQILPFVRKKSAAHAQRVDGVEIEFLSREQLAPYYAAVTGIEKEYRLSKVSKVSASMYGQNEIRIVYADALAAHESVQDGAYSVLVANPPYSVKGFLETLPESDRARYELFDATSDLSKSNSIECFFVERAKQLLAPGGVAAIILPSSILSNAGIYTKMREILLKYFDIVAIAEFGSGTFGKTGTNTATLFLRRKAGKPDLAEHYENRVEAWFEGDFSKDDVFADSHLLASYCAKIAIPLADYKTLLAGTPSEALLDTEIFKEYRKAFEASAESKNIQKKRATAKYAEPDRALELKKTWLNFARGIESEKLKFFMLAASNPQPVVLVKSPADNNAIKTFLGYDWSSRKGGEGIKYLGAASAESGEDDALPRNKGIAHIKTPLFNPANLTDSEKINAIIRAAFNAKPPPIPDSISEFVSRAKLTGMLDFSRVAFDKAFKTSPETKTENKFTIGNRFPIVVLKDACIFNPSKIEIKKEADGKNVSFIEMASVSNDGYITSKVDKPLGTLRKGSYTNFQNNDIIIAKITPCMENGKCAIAKGLTNGIGMGSSEFHVIRCGEKINHQFLFLLLNQEHIRKAAAAEMTGASGHRRVPVSFYENMSISLPPADVQRQIVSECELVDAECEAARKCIEKCKTTIVKLLDADSGGKKASLAQIGAFISERTNSSALTEKNYIGVDNLLANTQGKCDSDFVPTTGTSTQYQPKDILLSNIRPYLKKIWFADCNGGSSNDVLVFRVFNDEVMPEFVYQLLRQDTFFEYEMQTVRGMKMPRGDKQHILSYKVPVPSLTEQNRIIAEVEEIETEITAARTIIAAAPARKRAILTTYLQ